MCSVADGAAAAACAKFVVVTHLSCHHRGRARPRDGVRRCRSVQGGAQHGDSQRLKLEEVFPQVRLPHQLVLCHFCAMVCPNAFLRNCVLSAPGSPLTRRGVFVSTYIRHSSAFRGRLHRICQQWQRHVGGNRQPLPSPF